MFDVSNLSGIKFRDFYCQLGEQTGIGATCHLLRIWGLHILIDHGVSISRRGEVQIQGLPYGNYLQGIHIDILIVTHAHIDHMGAIATLVKHHPESWVFISEKALDATIFMLPDSLKIMRENARLAERLSQPVPEITFGEEDIEAFENNSRIVMIGEDQEELDHPDFPGFKFEFANSGHDVGAKMIKITDPSGRSYFITGDVASHDQEITLGVINPFINPCDVMVTEATNGAKPLVETRTRTWLRVERVLEEVSLRDGLVLFAAFMKNRSANMAMGLIDFGYVPVVDGSARQMMRLELGNDFVQGLLDRKKMIFIDENDPQIAWAQREQLLSGQRGFHPIICPSGTMEQGFATFYGSRLLPNRKNAVIFPGYRFPDSISRQIFDIERGRTIKLSIFDKRSRRFVPTPVNVVADVHHFDFSSHDYQQGLVERVILARPKLLIVHHCDDATYPIYVAALEKRHTELNLPLPRIVRGTHREEIEL